MGKGRIFSVSLGHNNRHTWAPLKKEAWCWKVPSPQPYSHLWLRHGFQCLIFDPSHVWVGR